MERKIIFRCRVGSHLYGLQRTESDEDYMSVFIPTSKDLLGLNPVNEVDNSTKSSSADRRNTAGDVDDKAYALPKFMHLLLGNNPNIVEVLFATSDVVEVLEPEFQTLVDNYQKIVSQKVFHTFTGYAFSQKKKLTVKSERYGSLVESVHDMERKFSTEELHDTKRAITEEESSYLNKTLKYYKGRDGNTESFHKGMPLKTIYEKLVYERDNYGWRVKTDTFDQLGYDVKFGAHMIRIMIEGIYLLESGKLSFPFSGDDYNTLMRIRKGEIDLNQLYKIYDFYDSKIMSLKEKTELRKKPDFNWANDYLIRTLKNSIISET